MAGLAGIAPKNGRLVRPFLCLTREEPAAYAKEHHVPYRTDATNADTALTRNFIRAEVTDAQGKMAWSRVIRLNEGQNRG